jgi:D-glycero-alpha-D-manno-heptose-7-phosphate kinase
VHRMKHETLEVAAQIEEFSNPIVRTVLGRYDTARNSAIKGYSWDVTSISDVPAGTGLGSSSTFTVGLIGAVRRSLGLTVSPYGLAREAVDIETNVLKTAAGFQDQYCAALGGFLYLRFLPSGEVVAEQLSLSDTTLKALQASTVLFYTGITRSGSLILEQRRQLTSAKRSELRQLRALAGELRNLLLSETSLAELGPLMHEGWTLKRKLGQAVSTDQIDHWYARGLANGATGGKLMGAGGGGYLLFFCAPEMRSALIQSLPDLTHVPFEFEFSGSTALLV